MALILAEIKENIGCITLNNPRKRNAFSEELLGDMLDAIADFEQKKIAVIVLRAEKNAKVWSAGHDVTELPKSRRDPLPYYSPLEKALRVVQHYPGAVIAMVQGGVWGGACDLVITCDMIIGDPTCTFAITPVKLGLPYNPTGILHFITRLGINIAKEMFFTADPVSAEKAEKWGILNHLVPTEELENFTFNIAGTIASRSPLAIGVIKEQFRILCDAHPITPETFERMQGLRRKVYDSHDYTEGINAFLEKRNPVFRGE
ncbi:MAG: methylmalonyl-CoA decarboxylase [Candidatus Eremiobacterota bacterium]